MPIFHQSFKKVWTQPKPDRPINIQIISFLFPFQNYLSFSRSTSSFRVSLSLSICLAVYLSVYYNETFSNLSFSSNSLDRRIVFWRRPKNLPRKVLQTTSRFRQAKAEELLRRSGKTGLNWIYPDSTGLNWIKNFLNRIKTGS